MAHKIKQEIVCCSWISCWQLFRGWLFRSGLIPVVSSPVNEEDNSDLICLAAHYQKLRMTIVHLNLKCH